VFKRIKLILVIAIFALVLLALFFNLDFNKQENLQTTQIQIGSKVFTAEIAQSLNARVQGLSGRKSLAKGKGMFFISDKEDFQGFWMKDMNFPIDIIWIGRDLKVKDITYNISPITYPEVFYSKVPIQFVLEVNAFESEGISIGDKVNFR